MSRKSCALIGPGVGPKVQVGSKARVSLRGLLEYECAVIEVFEGERRTGVHLADTELFDIPSCSFARVSYEGQNKGFIACILTGGSEDAVHSS